MFAKLTLEQEMEILIAALIHEIQTAAAIAKFQLYPAISRSLSPSSSQVL